MEFFYYSKRCRKQRQMSSSSTSPRGRAIYGDMARTYAAKAQQSIHDLTFPHFDGQTPPSCRHRAFGDIALRRYLGGDFAR